MFRYLFLLISLFAYSEEVKTVTQPLVCYFLPPSDWQIAQPKQLSSYVQVGFVGKGSTEFHPSINLAFEEVDVPLKEYIKAVKKIHTAQPNTQWRDLGKFPMLGGVGRLTEITSSSPWGDIKMLQAILIKGEMAYILTGATLKQDLPKFQNEILKSFKSLNLAPDLWTPIPDEQKRSEAKEAFASLGKFLPEIDLDKQKESQWKLVQKIASEESNRMGPHWQFLFLKEGHAKVYSSNALETASQSVK